MDIKNMPHVTVEQVSKFRDAALQALNKKDAELAYAGVRIAELEARVEFFEAIIAGDGALITGLKAEIAELRKALGAMLTEMGMDEDEHNKPTFNQARRALEK